jgi:anaerobic C4-dicarboxylate transporter
MENDFDYKKIFIDNRDVSSADMSAKTERKQKKEKKYIAMFFIQSVICILIIGSIIVAKYTTPGMFVSVSSALNGLYENNITLSDLNRLIDERLSENEAIAAFFNINTTGD